MSNYFAGLDWASKTHALCVIDERGGVVERFDIDHDAGGLTELRRRLRRFGSPPVAIERPSACWSIPWSMPTSRSCRSIPTP